MAIQTTMRMKVGDSWINFPNLPASPMATIINNADELAMYVDPKKYLGDSDKYSDQGFGMVLYDIKPGNYNISKTEIPSDTMVTNIFFSISMQVKKSISLYIGLTCCGLSNTHEFSAVEVGNEGTDTGIIKTEYISSQDIAPENIVIDNEYLSMAFEIEPNPLFTIIPVGFKVLISTEKSLFNKIYNDNIDNNEPFFNTYGLNGRFTLPLDLSKYEISFEVPNYVANKPERKIIYGGLPALIELPIITDSGVIITGWKYNNQIWSQGESITINNVNSDISIPAVIEPDMSGIVVGQPIAK